MDFKSATDVLTESTTAGDIAREAGVAPNTIARARLSPSSSAYRSPPANWREAVIRLAEDRINKLRQLVEELKKG